MITSLLLPQISSSVTSVTPSINSYFLFSGGLPFLSLLCLYLDAFGLKIFIVYCVLETMQDSRNIDKNLQTSRSLRRQGRPVSPTMSWVPCKVNARMFAEETQMELEVKGRKDFPMEVNI